MNVIAECEEALARLQKTLPISSLGDLDEEEFESTIDQIGDDTLIRRARHAVSENQRTLKAKAELEAGNLEAFGQLLNDSHHSLRYDYEVTGIELDTLVDLCSKTRRCLRCTNDRSWIWWLCDCSCQRRKYTCLQKQCL